MSSSRPPIDFKAVKDLVSMDDVLRLIGWKPVRREPSGLRGPCPVHQSHNPRSRSFAVCEKGYCCFGCNACGDQIDLYARVNGLGLYEGAQALCEAMGIAVPRPAFYRQRNGEEER